MWNICFVACCHLMFNVTKHWRCWYPASLCTLILSRLWWPSVTLLLSKTSLTRRRIRFPVYLLPMASSSTGTGRLTAVFFSRVGYAYRSTIFCTGLQYRRHCYDSRWFVRNTADSSVLLVSHNDVEMWGWLNNCSTLLTGSLLQSTVYSGSRLR